MKNLSIFCITLKPQHEKIIPSLGYIPVGLGNEKFSKNFFSDKTGNNIASKNDHYGEYTFHYWLWKNYLDKIETKWIGFCQYRKFFLDKDLTNNKIDFEFLQNSTIKEIENSHQFDCILGHKFSVEKFKLSKIIKHHLLEFLVNPKVLFIKKKRTLKFHFDLFHGKGNLDKAINLLDNTYKKDFKNYMNTETSFHPHNMFICRKEILEKYYNVIFPWLERCEKEFGFKDLDGYGLKRIYGFLAERFLSFWFSKNYRVKELPILVKDISSFVI